MKLSKIFSGVLILSILISLLGCAHGRKTPVILDHKPEQPYEVIQPIEAKVEWGGFQWIWFWWHYMPWYSSSNSIHREALIKKAKKLGADAVINVKYLPRRSGATGDAIRFK